MAKGDFDAARAIAEFIEKSGDERKAVQTLYEDNYELRRKNREANEEIEKLKKAVPDKERVLAEGEAKLSKEDADLLAKYKELGTIEEIGKVKEEHEALKLGEAKREKESSVRKAAEVAGFNPDVLLKLGADLDYEIEGKDDKKQVFVKDGDSGRKPLDEYAEENWASFMPSLQVEEGTRTVLGQSPAEGASGGGKKAPTEEDYIRDQEKRLETNLF